MGLVRLVVVLAMAASCCAAQQASFRIVPLRPVEELRTEALKAQPPEEQGNFRKPELVELTTLDPRSGQPAIEHIRVALEGGRHVVTANKGPIAYAYRELRALALGDVANEYQPRRQAAPAHQVADAVDGDLFAAFLRVARYAGAELARLRIDTGQHDLLLDPQLTASYETDWTGRFSGPASCVVDNHRLGS